MRRPTGALDGEEHLVKEVEDGGVQILFVGLLLLFQLVALWVAFGDTTVGFLRGVELAGSVFDAPHSGLVTGEDTEVILLAQALEEFLHLLGRNFGIGTDDEQDASRRTRSATSSMRGKGSTSSWSLAGRLEHRRETVAHEVVHLIFRRVVCQALQELGEVLLAIEVVAALRGVVQIPGRLFQLLKGGRNSDGSRSGDTRHSTISSRVRPFTALTAVERLAVSSSEPVAASLPVFRSITCACAEALPSQRSLAMTSRMPEISVSLSRTS